MVDTVKTSLHRLPTKEGIYDFIKTNQHIKTTIPDLAAKDLGLFTIYMNEAKYFIVYEFVYHHLIWITYQNFEFRYCNFIFLLEYSVLSEDNRFRFI